MTFQLDLVTLGSVLAILATIFGWALTWRKTAMNEQRQRDRVDSLETEVAELRGDIDTVRKCYQTTDGAIIRIETRLDNLQKVMDEIKNDIKDIRK